MKRLLLDFLWTGLRSLGAFERGPAAAGLLPMYDAWFAESVRVLEAGGYPVRDAGSRPHRPLGELWREWDAETPRWRDNPDLADIHVLLETMLRALPDVLIGKRRATEVMFPEGSTRLVENVYKANPESVFFNRVLAAELVAHVRDRADVEPGFAPRILEIGAGTGATSAIVLEAVRAAGLAVREYRYTDLSRAFLDHAERSYGPAGPFLTYGILDIERPVAEQGIDVGSHDVVIAANVLHATRDIRTTLRNTKAALKKGGLLLLNEATTNILVNQFTFALLEGWWRHEDEDAGTRIPGSPLLSAEGWRRVLAEAGFEPVTWPAAEAADLGQQIIVAVSDGVVRQPGTGEPEPAAPALEPVRARGESVAPDRLREYVEGVALGILAESLRIDPARIDRHGAFSDYGLDSIYAVQVARAVGTALALDLDVTLLFEYTTLADLGEFIATEYATEIHAVVETPVAAGTAEAGPVGMAIVGMSARFAEAGDVEEFWRIIEAGERCLTTPPSGRADWAQWDGADTSAWWAGFMDHVHEFDPLFFGMSMTEARQLPPELRLMVMTAWNAIEDAGYRPSQLRERSTGVFVAATTSEYRPGAPDGGVSLLGLPTPAMIPGRISHLFDLHGPSEHYDTTCSSSLVALHRAIRSIRDGECDQALVGGVQLAASPAAFEVMRAGGMLTAGGNVRPFQKDADGTARGEGVAAVLIKPLATAIEDGDFVYGVVRGTGVAHGGKGVSPTAPNIRGMKSAMTRAYADAAVDPGSVSYIETHSMSTLLADSAEITALRAGLRTGGDVTYLGSLKPCIGHTEVCSGLAALVKTVEAVRRGVVPAIPGFGGLHPELSFAGTPFRIAGTAVPWPDRTDDTGRLLPRRASINSFGIGGVNAHAVVEQYVERDPGRVEDNRPRLLVLSARTEEALRERVGRLAVRLADAASFADIAYTLQTGREEMDCRVAVIAATAAAAVAALESWLDTEPHARSRVVQAEAQHGDTHLIALAEQWIAGRPVEWNSLQEGKRRRVPLPGYPFERKVCFAQEPRSSVAVTTGPADFVTGVVASVLGLPDHEIDRTKPLAAFGLNSLLLTGVLSRLRGAFPAFRPEWLQTHDTLDDVAARLTTAGVSSAGPRFPELLHLNDVGEGRPVFWIHGALAGVEAYRTIATRIARPFYGIQARGFMTDHEPIEGIPDMAGYYLDIMRSVQPEGPYDVGGFCLGGLVAYEITRLLQLRGQVVRSLTMVDSPDNTGWAKSNESGSGSARSAALQVVNSMLWPAGEKRLDEVRRRLIHRDEVSGVPDDAAFVRRLAELAAGRGLAMERDRIVHFVERNMRVQLAYRIDEYQIRPLEEPEAPDCTYFRNRRGLFLGELEPYFQVAGETFSLDHITYWQDWERELRGLRVVDVDAANHMALLHEDGPLTAIERACVAAYHEDG
jgi:3-oxoacyl-(acyl-carrier-protein) synthase/thioesterase domain-containing protein/SAM-dependent methyltransferase